MKILGLDVGTARIGAAVVESTTRIPIPIGAITVDGSEWQAIESIVRLRKIELIVLGLPRSNSGNETKQSEYVHSFKKTLAKHLPDTTITYQDESLTSVIAEERLKSRDHAYEKGDIDAEAAVIILEDYVENLASHEN